MFRCHETDRRFTKRPWKFVVARPALVSREPTNDECPCTLRPLCPKFVPEAQALLRGRGPHYGTGAAQVHTVSALGLTTLGGDAMCRTGGIELGGSYGCWDTGGGLDAKELLIERGLRWSSE
jgi:hypothetical protein